MDSVQEGTVPLAGNWKDHGSQIEKFYAGKHVLLTGCTGFLGSLILEKLLRTCDVAKIYILIRRKRDTSLEERLEKMFKNEVFDRMRAANPGFSERIVPIYGDLQKEDLGISPADRLRLTDNVNIIVHNAAMVYFDAKPSVLLRTNVIGTWKLLELAAECGGLDLFVYTSTAYSYHQSRTIKEEFYAPPCGLDMIRDIIRVDEENATGLSKEALDDIVGDWLNVYSFSKAVTEGVVQDFARRHSLPCVVYRPSIIIETYAEPIENWLGNQHGPALISHAIALGIVRVIKMPKKAKVDLVPADFMVNNLLAITWDHVTNRESKEPEVYNYGSSDWNPFLGGMFAEQFSSAIRKYPFADMVWYPSFLMVESDIAFLLFHTLLHVFPAIIIDLILLTRMKKPTAVKLLLKASKSHKLLSHFFTNWIIKADKSKRVLGRMNAADLAQFRFDLNQIDWSKRTEKLFCAIHRLRKEPYKSPVADKKFRTMKMAHYIVCGVLLLLWLFLAHRLIRSFSGL